MLRGKGWWERSQRLKGKTHAAALLLQLRPPRLCRRHANARIRAQGRRLQRVSEGRGISQHSSRRRGKETTFVLAPRLELLLHFLELLILLLLEGLVRHLCDSRSGDSRSGDSPLRQQSCWKTSSFLLQQQQVRPGALTKHAPVCSTHHAILSGATMNGTRRSRCQERRKEGSQESSANKRRARKVDDCKLSLARPWCAAVSIAAGEKPTSFAWKESSRKQQRQACSTD